MGLGVLGFYMADFLALRIPFVDSAELESVYKHIKNRPILNVWNEYGSAVSKNAKSAFSPPIDRSELDGIIFDALRLTHDERDAVYESVIRLVEARLNKAASLNSATKSVEDEED